jgi:four helix bundle protein
MNYGFQNLLVYQKAYKLSMDIYQLIQKFPKYETYSLTDQILRSSRSVCANIAEGNAKRIYKKYFVSKMSDADGERLETIVWLSYANDCHYITLLERNPIAEGYTEVGKLLNYYMNNPEKFSGK